MKILLVDDSTTMRRILKNTLTKAGYSEVIEAEHGKAALEVLEKEKADLVLLDWNMPVMNGLELLKAMKARTMQNPREGINTNRSPTIPGILRTRLE